MWHLSSRVGKFPRKQGTDAPKGLLFRAGQFPGYDSVRLQRVLSKLCPNIDSAIANQYPVIEFRYSRALVAFYSQLANGRKNMTVLLVVVIKIIDIAFPNRNITYRFPERFKEFIYQWCWISMRVYGVQSAKRLG